MSNAQIAARWMEVALDWPPFRWRAVSCRNADVAGGLRDQPRHW